MTLPVNKVLCGWCLKPFERGQLIGVGDALVCETCKPAYIENLRTREHRQQKNKYLYRAVTENGKTVTEAIESSNIDAAKYALELRGYRDVVFLEDDISAAAIRTFDASDNHIDKITPKQRAQAIQTKATFFGMLGQFLKSWWWVYLILGFTIYRNVAAGTPFSGWAIASYVVLGFSVILYTFVSIPLALYGRLIRAVEWGRWDIVEGTVARIRSLNPFMIARIPAFELDSRSAQVNAARGNLQTALEILKPYESDAKVEPFLYFTKLAQIHYDARIYDKVIENYEKAIEAAPHIGGNYLDMAMYQARLMKDAEQAKFYLEKGLEHTLVPYAQAWVEFIRGLVAALEGKTLEAKLFYQQSLEVISKFMHMPFMTGFRHLVSAHLVIALAQLGEREVARALFGEAREWLVSTRQDELLQQCESAIGGSASALTPGTSIV